MMLLFLSLTSRPEITREVERKIFQAQWSRTPCRLPKTCGVAASAIMGPTIGDMSKVVLRRQQTPKIALHTAVEENDMDVVLQLLNNGADVNMKQDRMSSMRGSRLVRNVFYDVSNVLLENVLMSM